METRKKPYKIAIVDDEALFRRGINMLIDHHPDLIPSISAEHGQDLLMKLENLTHEELPDLILCDLEMPILDGVDTTRKVIEKYKDLKIVILSSHYEASLIMKMIELGASSFIAKDEEPEEFYRTIINVIDKGFHYNDFIVQLIREKMHFGPKPQRGQLVSLTGREVDVLKLICEQKTNKEIGEELYISSRTVEGHRTNIIEKTQSKNTAGLIIFAVENGYYQINLKKTKWT